jgi:hypothetical protein
VLLVSTGVGRSLLLSVDVIEHVGREDLIVAWIDARLSR